MILQMDEAKMVLMKDGKRDISQVQRFVVDKGDWLTISENSRSKVKAGLFIVEMPNSANVQYKPVGTPLQLPMKTNAYNKGARADSGLEICSDVSELFIDDEEFDDEDPGDSLLLDDDEDREDYEQDMMNMQHEKDEEEEEQEYIPIGDGQDQYSFLFRVMEANNLATITNRYTNNATKAFFRYEFADRQFQCRANYDEDNWDAMEYANDIMLQGHLEDILAWLEEQVCITVYLHILDEQDKQEIIGFSDIYLTGRELGVINQSSIVYDCEKTLHINSDKLFSKLQLQIGLAKGWDDLDYSLLKE
ncbi:unnamed protein product [Mucor hiemalis]